MTIPHQLIQVQVRHTNPLIRAGLAAILSTDSDIVVATADSDFPCDVIVTDYDDGLWRIQQAPTQQTLSKRVLIVTENDREWNLRIAVTSGVHGYMSQKGSAQELSEAVRTLSRGLRYISPVLTPRLAAGMSRISLTGRENDVLRLLARGFCNKVIARELGIGIGTVKTHVKGLFEKLGVSARTQAVVRATERGLV